MPFFNFLCDFWNARDWQANDGPSIYLDINNLGTLSFIGTF